MRTLPVLLFLLQLACSAQTFSQPSNSHASIITFQVTDAHTGRAVQATVHMASPFFQQSLETDHSGKSRFEVPPQKYQVTVTAPLYRPQSTYYTPEASGRLNIGVMLDPVAAEEAPSNTGSRKPFMAVVSGYVVDGETAEPLAGARVRLSRNGRETVTDTAGFFTLASGRYTPGTAEDGDEVKTTVIIEKDGYKKFLFRGLLLFEDVVLLKIKLAKGAGETVRDQHHPLRPAGRSRGILPPTLQGADEPHPEGLQPAPLPPAGCSAPATIRVYHGDNGSSCAGCNHCTTITQLSLETYVATGLDDEWIAGWNAESLKAGAVAYRTYACWRMANPRRPNYDINAYPCDQNWEGIDVSARTKAAAAATAGELLSGKSGQLQKAEYSSETNNSGCGDGRTGTGSSWPCIGDLLCTGRTSFGHGRGMCQYGSNRWAGKGKSYTAILDHYYNPGGIKRCSDPRPADVIILVDNAGTTEQGLACMKASVIRALDGPEFAGRAPFTVFQLATVKGNGLTAAPTRNVDVLKSQVASVTGEAGEGGPEALAEAVRVVKDRVRGWDNGKVVVFTRASFPAGQHAAGIAEELAFLGIKLSVPAPGDCGEKPQPGTTPVVVTRK